MQQVEHLVDHPAVDHSAFEIPDSGGARFNRHGFQSGLYQSGKIATVIALDCMDNGLNE